MIISNLLIGTELNWVVHRFPPQVLGHKIKPACGLAREEYEEGLHDKGEK